MRCTVADVFRAQLVLSGAGIALVLVVALVLLGVRAALRKVA